MVVICTHVKIIIIGSKPHIYRVNEKIAVPTVYLYNIILWLGGLIYKTLAKALAINVGGGARPITVLLVHAHELKITNKGSNKNYYETICLTYLAL